MKLTRTLGLALVLTFSAITPAIADGYLESLQPDQKINGFTTKNVYENGSGQAVGARFVSDKYGFIVDLVQIQSVPQAFYWVKTPPTSSKGEPHACEHLLLGKGNRGRYVSALEDMSLGTSTAYTAQTRTCYHFNTVAGDDTFYELFEAKLQALLHPDFTDEEIRREVCHIGVAVDPKDGTLSLDEKGTVYTEMVSSFERPWYHTYGELDKLVMGEGHPLTYNSGGDPDVMRKMTAEDMRIFHRTAYHLGNMGAVVSIPDNITVESCLKNLDEILNRCQDYADSSPNPGIGNFDFPLPNPAPLGTAEFVTYPSEKTEDPGYLLYSWPADLKLDYRERVALDLFLDTFARGQTSDLYNLFINSETRVIDLGGDEVDGWQDESYQSTIQFGLTGIDNAYVNQTMLDSALSIILGAVEKVRNYPDGSEQLREFNARAAGRVAELKKYFENSLNQPPMFGFRSGPAGRWVGLMEDLEDEAGFRKSLVLADRFAYLDSLLALDRNIWRDRIDTWRLLSVPPYEVGAGPGMDYIIAQKAAKEKRLEGYRANFREMYGGDDQAAIAAYKEYFDRTTAELEALASKDKLPGFIDNPPMTLDDQLIYETISLPGGIPLTASTFENMSSARVGLALRLDVIPESLLVYVPFLPSVLTDIGVIKDGEVVPFNVMQERLRREVLSLKASLSSNPENDRFELLLTGEGNNLVELRQAIGWMDAALFTPYIRIENAARMLDLIDQSLLRYRNRTKGPEEYWVNNPADAYRFQDNPLALAAGSFLTQTHLMQRLRWQLTDPGEGGDRAGLLNFLSGLKRDGDGLSRHGLAALLDGFADGGKTEAKIAQAFKTTLDEIPDENLSVDWAYLCDETRADLLVEPATAIARLNAMLDLVRKADNVRMFMISNSANREAVRDDLTALIGKLDSKHPSVRQTYIANPRITERLASREPGLVDPLYVGLVHRGTRNGVLIMTARIADKYDTTSTAILDGLAGKLYSGGGPHGLFMKTWAAGLAYSNGYRFSQITGRARYYAERCPDIAETMRFVVGQLKKAKRDPGLAEYAIAQVFGYSRAPNRYEARGQAMADDLVDGYTPERVQRYRQKVLDTRNRDDLYDQLTSRMEAAYGPVLIGYGAPLSESKESNFFIIGPESQFESLENYIETVEGKQTVYRLYPRDFWLTM